MSTNTADTNPDSLDEALPAVTVVHQPARLSSALAAGCGALAVLASAPASIVSLLIGVFGLAGLVAGQFVLESRRTAGIGTALIFLGVVAGGLFGNDEVLVTFSAFATIMAFDLSQNAFSVGTQLSAATDTRRGELVHATASLFVGAVAIVVAFTVYFVAGGGLTTAAVAFVLFAAILLSWALRS